jgi:hypothetical protein
VGEEILMRGVRFPIGERSLNNWSALARRAALPDPQRPLALYFSPEAGGWRLAITR